MRRAISGRPAAMAARVARLVWRPDSRRRWFAVERATDIDPNRLLEAGIKGVLLDVDGTLVPHLVRDFPLEVDAFIRTLGAAGLKVAIYSNAADLSPLRVLGIPVVTGVAKKPAPEGFLAAMALGLGMNQPDEVVMVGDNLISDGGAVDAGLRFIQCDPLPGSEPALHRLSRALAARIFKSLR